MYKSFSNDYDRFVNWTSRLAYEMPFIEKQIQSLGLVDGLRILDAACGSGMHAIAFAQKGYQAAGADLIPEMIEKSRQNAKAAAVDVHFEVAGLGSLTPVFGEEKFHFLVCLGNSLPHLLTAEEVDAALNDFYELLKPGGMLLIQNLNYDPLVLNNQRWMEPQSDTRDGEEWIFFRFYDYLPDRLIRFNINTLKRSQGGEWQSTVQHTFLRSQMSHELLKAIKKSGFQEIRTFGSMRGDDYLTENSPNLIITAIKK